MIVNKCEAVFDFELEPLHQVEAADSQKSESAQFIADGYKLGDLLCFDRIVGKLLTMPFSYPILSDREWIFHLI